MHLIKDGDKRSFVQIWPSAANGMWVQRSGTVGRAGVLTELDLDPATTPIEEIAAPFVAEGYAEVDDGDRAWVVAQFPTRSKRDDERLIDHATEWMAAVLDERGLGYVDGHDRGKRGGDGAIVVNVYAVVVDGDLGAEAVMAALRKGRADPQRATVAMRSAGSDDWLDRYDRTGGKLPGPFTI